MILWRVFQLLITFAGGSLIIWLGHSTKGPPPNPLIVFGFGALCAYGATNGLSWLIDFWRRKSARAP